jgi:hypothetical protein
VVPPSNDPTPDRAILDALPFPAFIVDEDVRLIAVNPAAARLAGGDPSFLLRQRGGEAWHCINSTETPHGCGRAPACKGCMVRNSVTFALAEGQPVRTRTVLEYLRDGELREMHALVTATPVQYGGEPRALLFIEDLPVLFAQTDMLPICMTCKRVRDDKLWVQIEAYLDSQLDLKFTHGICPDCVREFYPDYKPRRGADAVDGPATREG